MLVCGNSELAGTVEDELIVQPLALYGVCKTDQVPGPHVVDSEPQESQGEEEWVLIATDVAKCCKEK